MASQVQQSAQELRTLWGGSLAQGINFSCGEIGKLHLLRREFDQRLQVLRLHETQFAEHGRVQVSDTVKQDLSVLWRWIGVDAISGALPKWDGRCISSAQCISTNLLEQRIGRGSIGALVSAIMHHVIS